MNDLRLIHSHTALFEIEINLYKFFITYQFQIAKKVVLIVYDEIFFQVKFSFRIATIGINHVKRRFQVVDSNYPYGRQPDQNDNRVSHFRQTNKKRFGSSGQGIGGKACKYFFNKWSDVDSYITFGPEVAGTLRGIILGVRRHIPACWRQQL